MKTIKKIRETEGVDMQARQLRVPLMRMKLLAVFFLFLPVREESAGDKIFASLTAPNDAASLHLRFFKFCLLF